MEVKKGKRKQHVDRPVEPVHGPAEPSMGSRCQIHLPAAESGLVGPGSTVLHRIKLRAASHLTRRATTGGATPHAALPGARGSAPPMLLRRRFGSHRG